MIDKVEEVIDKKEKIKNKRLCILAGCTCVHAGQETGTRTRRRREQREARHSQRHVDGGRTAPELHFSHFTLS